MVRVDALVPATIGASTRSPLDVEISAKIPLRDLLRQCQDNTDWIGLYSATLVQPTGTGGDTVPVAASGVAIPCRLVPHSPYNELAALLMPWE
jgi:hypothetical protein